jgi:DNA-binding XRE family transcriptional regulator
MQRSLGTANFIYLLSHEPISFLQLFDILTVSWNLWSGCRVPSELKKRIQQARLEKKLTQAQLGNLINEKPSVITEYENGKAIPSPQVLSKLSRVLGVQLSAKKK